MDMNSQNNHVKGRRGDTVVPFIVPVAFFWLFAVKEGQKLMSASACSVCALFTEFHSPWQMGSSQDHCILNPSLVGFIILFFDQKCNSEN